MREWVAFVLVMGLALPGCSLLVVKRAPRADPGFRPLTCTRSLVPPVIDSVVGASFLIATAAVIGAGLSAKTDVAEARSSAFGLAVVLGPVGLGFTGSAYYGYTRVATCREMNRRPMPAATP